MLVSLMTVVVEGLGGRETSLEAGSLRRGDGVDAFGWCPSSIAAQARDAKNRMSMEDRGVREYD